ncbi:MAG: hypothetical protein PHY73_00955 [Candidatus Omnitrophica bacterium]|nr:hypothetical protein [Candidatus Omnitrophota bacterium]
MTENTENQEQKKKALLPDVEQVDFKDYQAQRQKDIELHQKNKKQKKLISKIFTSIGLIFAALSFCVMAYFAFMLATAPK